MNTKLLRQKILDLAIRGKLTDQKKSDGTTKDLLKQIRDERTGEALQTRDASTCHCEAQKRRGNLKQSKSATPKEIIPLDKSEAPFEIPENWEWVRLGDLCSSVSSGKTPSTIQKELWDGDVLWVTSKDVKQKYIQSTQVRLSVLGAESMRLYPKNTMIIVGRSGILRHTLPVSILKQEATINQDLKALVFLNGDFVEYIYIAIKGMEQNLLHCYKKAGTTVDNLNFDEFLTAGIPIPPLAEQQRIVTAIENAFAEITEIENNQELLKKHIKQGRQKILDLAIRGKLTQQLKTDGTTKDLLESIMAASSECHPERSAAKSKDPAKKKSKNADPKQIIPLDKSEAPFEIPENWEIVKYGDVVSNVSTKNYQVKTSEIKLKGSFPVVSQGQDFIDGYVDDKTKLICANENPIVLFGDHTRVVKYIDFDFVVGADGTKIIKPLKILESKYLYFATQAIVEKIEDRGYGRHFSLLSNSFLPLPPLAEQQRIVAAIEQAFTEFDAMEIDLK